MKLKFILPATIAALAITAPAMADNNKREKRDRRPQASSSETYGAGAVDVQRNRARAGVVSGARAEGPGTNTARSTVDASGEVTRDGAYADIYGDSDASAEEARPRRRPN